MKIVSSMQPLTLFTPATSHVAPKVCVVAEIGVNHDGSVEQAMALIHAAKKAGADAVKFQLFDPRSLLSSQARLAQYQEASDNDVFTMLDRLKLSVEQMQPLRALAKSLELGFFATPFSLDDVPGLQSLNVDAVKIASPDAVNFPLLKQAALLGKPMLISTGTCDIEELTFAANLLLNHEAGGCLLQCISSYPAPDSQAALGAIPAMAKRFGLPVGYSDHSNTLLTGALAVAAGACVIERHLTLDTQAPGPDHAASLDVPSFTEYVQLIRRTVTMLGPTAKKVQSVEAEVRAISRQSVCALRDLPAGHVLGKNDLTIKRPGTGIPAAQLENILGSVLQRAVRGNDILQHDDICSSVRQAV